ncbi:hypothetical protein COY32_01535 [candidate division WWE3 bacterium CG_4_10_14_0_2_um_filter_41_14]|uniref:Uncharacterized protein n=1 Tax=candidate division WWE3 bacterium CG_4_10_14_0_2_um_filter_41_14 TaxID=1975072 RepID=A0A2M7TLM2_UNCKA|nr:MAG: hypothetical protein COY32_01535 [candidate division WWE3 bacterium CG_4_10_14_0_2_um_filter_41_14]
MNIPKQLTTVTILSKLIAGVLFITLPFVGFWVGMVYEKSTTLSPSVLEPSIPASNTAKLEEVAFTDMPDLFNSCISTLNQKEREKEFVINTNEDYQTLLSYLSPSNLCNSLLLPKVNFLNFTLLGKYTEGGGCRVDFERHIFKSDISDEILYNIDVKTSGYCKALTSSMNWILVPKISNNYKVKFNVTHTSTDQSKSAKSETAPSNSTNEIDSCNTMANSHFVSIAKHEVGLGPNGPAMGYWGITFQKGTPLSDYGEPTFDWSYSDAGEYGTYTCSENTITAKLSNRTITATYNETTKILNWDGVDYKIYTIENLKEPSIDD